jgi:hypothetical protein
MTLEDVEGASAQRGTAITAPPHAALPIGTQPVERAASASQRPGGGASDATRPPISVEGTPPMAPSFDDKGPDAWMSRCLKHDLDWAFDTAHGGWRCPAPDFTRTGLCDSRPTKWWAQQHLPPAETIEGTSVPRPDQEPEEDPGRNPSLAVAPVAEAEELPDWRPSAERVVELAQGVQPKDVWRYLPRRCWTCGAAPSGAFPDSSPRFGCLHEPAPLPRDGSGEWPH